MTTPRIQPLQLLIVDPQNDFCDIPGATLPVTGADADMKRLAALVDQAGGAIADIVVTLDSHAVYAIERPAFWQVPGDDGTGEAPQPVAPFTQIKAEDVRAGRFAPRDAALREPVLAYLDALEASPKKYILMVWPTHCVVGTWGHNVHAELAAALGRWEAARLRTVEKVLKGQNPMTEQYSAVRAEVPIASDPRTQTHRALVDRIVDFPGLTFIAGEASSHCVAATAEDLFGEMSAERLGRVVLIEDAMSPVGGFEAGAGAFVERARALGVRTMTAAQALGLLSA
ncbi:cysteine hydrolase [Roseateles chitinivorans]|uniref:cysteine hydrolase n=1 Tax=Roseateles chitinivorans TaxID=2917965 RepID=UPI003D6708A3